MIACTRDQFVTVFTCMLIRNFNGVEKKFLSMIRLPPEVEGSTANESCTADDAYATPGGLNSLVSIVKAMVRFFTNTHNESVLCEFDEDTEMGLQPPSIESQPLEACSHNFSAFEAMHSAPVIFPSSLAALLPNTKKTSPPRKAPEGPAPDFPCLPDPIARNFYSRSSARYKLSIL